MCEQVISPATRICHHPVLDTSQLLRFVAKNARDSGENCCTGTVFIMAGGEAAREPDTRLG